MKEVVPKYPRISENKIPAQETYFLGGIRKELIIGKWKRIK